VNNGARHKPGPSGNAIKDASVTTTGATLAAGLSIVQAVIVAKILGPTVYGKLHIYRLILAYAVFSNVGTYWAMVREISVCRGRNDQAEIDHIRDATFTFNLFVGTLVSLIVILALSLKPSHASQPVEAVLVGCIIVAQQIFNFFRNYFIASKDFVTRAFLVTIFPLANIILVIVLGIPFGLKGVLLAILFANFIGVFYAVWKSRFRPKVRIKKDTLIRLIKTGAPISGNGFLALAVNSIDRLIILYLLPITALGYYGIAVMLKGLMDTLYRSAFMAIFPRISESYGRTDSVLALKDYIWKPIYVSAHLLPVLLGPMVILIDPLIRYVLPKYGQSIVPAQLIILASFFGCLQIGIINFFIAINKVYRVYHLRIMAIFFGAICIFIAINRNLAIRGVALAFVLIMAFLAIALLWAFLSNYSLTLAIKFKYLTCAFYPFLYMSLCLWFSGVIKTLCWKFTSDTILSASFHVIVYLVLIIPLITVIQARTRVIGQLMRSIRGLGLSRS